MQEINLQEVENKKKKKSDKTSYKIIFKDYMENGCHYGRTKRFLHPSMKNFVMYGKNTNITYFNLKKTSENFDNMVNLLKKILEDKKIILFVGCKPAAENAIKKIAYEFNMPYVIYKWIGGLLTNFETIKKRILYFKELLKKEESGELEEYPIYEMQKIKKELEKMKKMYSGLINLENLPDYVFIVDLNFKNHKTAVRECLKKNIPILSLSGSDNNVSIVYYFIPANDKAPKSIDYIIDSLMRRIKQI